MRRDVRLSGAAPAALKRHDGEEAPPHTTSSLAGRWFPAWWMRLTAPPEATAATLATPFTTRDRIRRGQLLGMLILGFLVILLGALFQYLVIDSDHPLMDVILCAALSMLVVVAVLNRLGYVSAAGVLLTALAELPLAGIWATGGHVDLLGLGSYYLLVGAGLVAASVLLPVSVFAVAFLNCVLIWASITFSPHTAAFAAVLASNDAQQVYAGPIAMQVMVAIVAYLWARSTLGALRRADRAEEIAALERRELERQRALEDDARDLLGVHVRLANGDFSPRVASLRTRLLWQVGTSLNNLIGRLARYAQAEFMLRREHEEVRRLAEALYLERQGRRPVWPVPCGVPLDPVTEALRESGGRTSGYLS